MIESILQIIGMLTIVLGLAALIVAEIYRYEYIKLLNQNIVNIEQRLIKLENPK